MSEAIDGLTISDEQLKALYDPIRIRISHLLKTPRTPKQVADIINVRPNNLYYHFRVLEKAGIIEQVKTKQGKGFVKENFFKLVSDDLLITPKMVPLDARMTFFQSLIRAAMEDLGESLDKFETISGVGSRDDFSLPEEKLEEVKNFLERTHYQVLQQIAPEQRKTLLINLDLLKASMEAVREMMV